MRQYVGAACGMVMLSAGLVFTAPVWADQALPKHPLAQEHPIVIDATGIVPPIAWSVPGVTEPVQSVHGRMVTDKVVTLQLRPGKYMFMTTIFSFEFTVSLDGKLDYMKSIDRCVRGRDTSMLLVTCRKMQPVEP